MTDILYATDCLTLTQLKATLRKFRRHERLGFYIVANEREYNSATGAALFDVELFGPKIYWAKKTTWELKVANTLGVSN